MFLVVSPVSLLDKQKTGVGPLPQAWFSKFLPVKVVLPHLLSLEELVPLDA